MRGLRIEGVDGNMNSSDADVKLSDYELIIVIEKQNKIFKKINIVPKNKSY